LPADFPAPIVVVQHIPPRFTAPLAKRLNDYCALTVTEATHLELLRAGTIYIAPGGIHLTVGWNSAAGGIRDGCHACFRASAAPRPAALRRCAVGAQFHLRAHHRLTGYRAGVTYRERNHE